MIPGARDKLRQKGTTNLPSPSGTRVRPQSSISFSNNISDGMNVVTFHTPDVPASMPQYIAFLQYMQCVAVHCSVLQCVAVR